MRAGTGALLLGALAAVLGAAACRPEVQYNPEGRGSAIDAIDVRGTVSPAGVFHADETVTFADNGGGTVEIAAPRGLGAVRNVAVDGAPAATSTNTFGDQEVRIARASAVVSFDVDGAVTRYADIAVLDATMVASPEEAVRQDPDIDLTGTITLPEAAPGPLYPHLYAGRDRKIEPHGGNTVAFSSRAPIWTDGSLVLAFPSALVPAARCRTPRSCRRSRRSSRRGRSPSRPRRRPSGASTARVRSSAGRSPPSPSGCRRSSGSESSAMPSR
ncbi:MAG TPA: hypothetical protein VFA62_06490 [Acidimicrobiia bacterium]|nr:hypothetical protein [Acidimicrobiia bacterium]